MRAAGIVAYHSAKGAAAVRGRVRAKGKLVLLGGITQAVADRARLDQCGARRGIDREHMIEVLGTVDDHRDVDALAVLRGTAAAGEYGHIVPAANGHGRLDVGHRARQHHAYWHLTVVGGIGRIHRAHGAVKAYLACYGGAQFGGKGFSGDGGI